MLRLKQLRSEKGISQNKLAIDIGVSRSTISMWESGGSQPDNNSLIELSNYFNVTADYLLGRDEKKEPSVDEQLDGINFALLDGAKGLNDDQKRAVLKFIKMLQEEDE